MSFLLALDASTTEIGYSIWDIETKKLFHLHHYTFKSNGLLPKADEYEEFIRDLRSKFLITDMVIEECYEAMFGGMSSSHTTAILNQMNAVVQYITHSQNIEVHNITVSKSRKAAFPTVVLRPKKFSGGLSHKEQIFTAVLAEIGETYFPTKILKSGKRKGETEFESYCMDMSDAYTIGKGFLNLKK